MRISESDEFLADLEKELINQGVEPAKARSAATAIGLRWGGQSVYIRLRGHYLTIAVANAFDGTNANALATRFRVSRSQIYKLLDQTRKNDRENRLEQARLPGI